MGRDVDAHLESRPLNHNGVLDKSALATDQSLSNFHRVWTSLAAGAAAGGLAKTTIAPFDRTKINFQISNRPYSTKKALRFLAETYQKEGVVSLWRGNSATMARIIPYAAIQFTAHEQWKRILGVDVIKGEKEAGLGAARDKSLEAWTTPHTSDHHQYISLNRGDPKVRFLAGSLAGVTSQSLTYPLDLARAQMAVTGKENYSSLMQVFSKTWKENGLKGFYRGYVPTIIGVIPYAGTSFYTYGMLKLWCIDKFGEPNPLSNLCCGACAGMLGQSTSYPLDIVRRRMQTSTITGVEYKSIMGTLQKIYREEGVRRGFFKGLSMNWVKGPIAVGISFASYDYVLFFLRNLLNKHYVTKL